MSDRTKFQGRCFVRADGYRYMTTYFDVMPPSVRERARNSPFNLCAACISDESNRFNHLPDREHRLLAAIISMEDQIRAEDQRFLLLS